MKATHKPATAAIVAAVPIPSRVMIRALNRYYFESPTGCHVSTYSCGSHGYAQIGWQESGKVYMKLCHRVAWSAVFGDIPDGMTIDHTCKNRRCINVTHLRMLANYENARRTSGRDWPIGRCAQGHSSEHLREEWGGRLRCSLCAAEFQRNYRAKKAGVA